MSRTIRTLAVCAWSVCQPVFLGGCSDVAKRWPISVFERNTQVVFAGFDPERVTVDFALCTLTLERGSLPRIAQLTDDECESVAAFFEESAVHAFLVDEESCGNVINHDTRTSFTGSYVGEGEVRKEVTGCLHLVFDRVQSRLQEIILPHFPP